MNELLNSPQHKQVIECIESWHNEDYTQWYRIYSDGWCEQGGIALNTVSNYQRATINLIKPFINTNYLVHQNADWFYANSDMNQEYFMCYNLTTTSFDTTLKIDKKVAWEAKGYISLT